MTTAKATVRLEPVDHRNLSTAEAKASQSFVNALRKERIPEDPPLSLERVLRNAHSLGAFDDFSVDWWHAWHQGRVVGRSFCYVRHNDDNRHLANVELAVLDSFRGQGLGRRLLGRASSFAQSMERSLMISVTTDRVPAGAAFAGRAGAQPGQAVRVSQLDLADLDHDLMTRWQTPPPATAEAYRLGLWTGPYPQQELDQIAQMYEVMNTAPKDDLDIEDERITPTVLRQQEAYMAKRATDRWTLHVRHHASGDLAGYTETFWEPDTSEILFQGDTGVLPDHRGRGLGKWLKAAMIGMITELRPQVQRVRTDNAISNGPMLAINQGMGFRPYYAETVWQLTVEAAERYLAGAGR